MKKYLKKFIALLVLAVFALGLTACSTSSNAKKNSSTNSSQVSVQIIENDQTRVYRVKKATTLMDLAKTKLHAKVSNGMINAIDGMKSDPAHKAYLMFKVNGKDSQVGASQVKLKKGDKVEFYISKY